jgi:ATP-dependent exoDNAse (exonuclease V) beta subunit
MAESPGGDAAARLAALDPARSILLQAPAGSGKTTLLTQRFLRLLAEVDEPEQILAVTFTRKAAAEMRTRIVGALRASEAPPRGAGGADLTLELAARALAQSRRRGWDMESNPARLRIQTLDGLNRSLAASLPIAAAAGQTLEVTQRERQIYLDAARRTLLDAEADAALQGHSDRLLRRLDNHWLRLEGLLADMLARRSHWLRHVAGSDPLDLRDRVEQTLAGIAAEALRAARARLPRALRLEGLRLAAQALRQADPGLAARLDALEDLGEDAAQLPAWCALVRLALTEEGELRKTVNARQGVPASDKALRSRALDWLAALRDAPAAVEALAALPRLPPVRFEPRDAAVLESLIVLLRYAAGQLELLFRDVRRVDYVAIAAAARTALGDAEAGTELTIHQGEQLRHLLVDEFQDTSLDQFELLEALTRDWEPGDGRSLFLVGDPMQSIYQFREAEVGLFLRARDSGLGRIAPEPLALTRNFRSDPAVVDFVNRTFATIFPRQDDPREAAVRYLACEAAGTREPAVEPRVRLRHLPPFDVQAEADAVLEIVRGLRSESPAATIAVLVSARGHAAPIARALRAAGIAVQGVDLIPLAEVPVVQDLIALTRALLDPADRIAWIGLLRAPWSGLDLASLARLLEGAPQATLAELLGDAARAQGLPADAVARLHHVHEALDAARAQLPRAPLAAVVEAAWLRLGGPVVYAEPSAVLDARRFLDAFAEREQGGEWTGVDDLGPLVARLFAASDTSADDAVQVMTIHRAKGLEFDAVILPSLGRAGRLGEEPLLSYVEWPDRDGEPQLLLAPIRAPESDEPSPLGAWIRALQNCRRDRERVRLLYVAATRARAALYLLGSLDAVKGGAPAPRAGSLLASLWPAVGLAFPPDPEVGALDPAALEATAPPRGWRAASPWSAPPLPPPLGAGAALEVATAELPDAPDARVRAAPLTRHVGLVVHAELERLAAAPRARVDDPVGELARYRRLLAAQGVPAVELEAQARRVQDALGRVVADPQGRWLLDPGHREAACGLALSGLYEGRFTSVRVDRSFVDAQGVRWLVDYRASPHEGGDLEAFVAAELRRHAPRLRRCAALARSLGPQPLRLALYFPLLPRLEEIPLTA